MVNTFITQSNLRFAVKDLDNRRLGKQRVEAQQILDKLYDCKAIIENYKYDIYTLTEGKMSKEYNIFKNVFKKYTKEQRKLYFFDNKYSFEEKGRKVSTGFAYHPATLAWIGFESGLKVYINFCIQEWISRGFKNDMKFYDKIENFDLPWWCDCYAVHLSHRSALLRKEIVRKEKMWYWNKEHIKEGVVDTNWYKLGYVWIVNLDEETIQRLKNKEILNAIQVCDKQTNDFV